MGLLDLLKPRPDQARFAEIARERLRALGAEGPFDFDAENFELKVGGHSVFLANLYADYLAAWPWRRRAVLDRYLGTMLQPEGAPQDFLRARQHLVPVLRSPIASESVRVHLALRGGQDVSPFAERPFAGEYSLCLVYDTPRSMAFINQGQLEEWKVPFERALEYALDNLAQATVPAFTSPSPGVFVSGWKDNYDPSRLLLLPIIRALPVQGRPVVALPHRDCLIVTGDQDEAGLLYLADLVGKEINTTRTIGAVPLVLEGEAWTVHDPAGGGAAALRLRRLVREGRGADYAEQKELLERLHEQRQEDVFVASYSGIVHPDTGELRTYATWTRGVRTLLPRTDLVALVDLRDEGGDPETLVVGWQDVRTHAAAFFHDTRHQPVRYLVDGFPEGELWVTLRALSEQRRASLGEPVL